MNTNPYMQNPYMQQNILPPQQILTAKGKPSIDKLKMSPNSSVLIADETAAIVWKCTSDGIGNVSAEPFDISPHKSEEQTQQETLDSLNALLLDMNDRLKRLEENYEPFINRNTANQHSTEPKGNQANVGNAKKYGKPTSNDGANAQE